MSWSTCKYCGDKIAWAQMPAGNWLPLDPEIGGIHECVPFNRSASYTRSLDPLVGFAYHSSMCDLAQELGYSVIFPKSCRFCGRMIYLFATPQGGFAIFDKLGKPWPKHICSSVRPLSRQYHEYDTLRSQAHRLPVPAQSQIQSVHENQTLTGTIVSVGDDGQAELYDGNCLYRLRPSLPTGIGTCVSGVIDTTIGPALLKVTERLEPSSQDVANSEKAACNSEVDPASFGSNREMADLGRFFGRALTTKVIWGVFNVSNKLVASFGYSHSEEAKAHAEKFTAERKLTHYVQQIKQLMRRS